MDVTGTSQFDGVRRFTTLGTIGALWLSGALILRGEDPALTRAQTAFDNWVRLQEAIAGEKREWAVEREYLAEEIRLLQEETKALEEREKTLTEETASLEKELQGYEEKKEELNAATAKASESLPDLEARARSLHASLPASLQGGGESLYRQLPEEGNAAPAGAAQRLQVVVGLLGQMDKFNGQLSVASEIRTNEAGEQIQVGVLYLGLAEAWFVSPDGKSAGFGKPAADGWNWTQQDALAPLVQRAIAINENTEVAAYVELPASVN